MKLHEILFEKINTDVTFEYIEDSEGDNNRGWQVDRLNALLDGKPVGYLKLSYIPKKRWKAHYPNILNFLSKIEGRSVLPYDYKDMDYHNIPLEELKKLIVHAYLAVDAYPSHEEQVRLENLPLNEVISEYEKIEKIANKNYSHKFKQSKNYFIDKPLVDYISVDKDFMRQGVGTAMYRAGYEWMKKKGMRLYASGTQTDLAKAAWSNLEKNYLVAKSKEKYMNKPITRRYFAG